MSFFCPRGGNLPGSHSCFKGGQTFPDFKGRGEFVVQVVNFRLNLATNGIDLVIQIVDLGIQTGKPIVNFVVQSLDLDFDTGQASPLFNFGSLFREEQPYLFEQPRP